MGARIGSCRRRRWCSGAALSGAGFPEPGDAEALASAIRGLVESPDDRARLGAAGRRRVEEMFSWRAVAAATAAAYEETIVDYRRERGGRRADR